MKDRYVFVLCAGIMVPFFLAGYWLTVGGASPAQEPEMAPDTKAVEKPPEKAPMRAEPQMVVVDPRPMNPPVNPVVVGGLGRGGAPWIPPGYDDHQNMMDQLGVRMLRPGRSGSNQTGPGFEETTANEWMPTMPQALVMRDGIKVTTAGQWTKRRAEIVEDFEREVYGRIPKETPAINWNDSVLDSNIMGTPTKVHMLVGMIDNAKFPAIAVTIRARVTVPANAGGPVPLLMKFGGAGTNSPARGGAATAPSWTTQAIEHGWGFGSFDPTSVQADSGGNSLRQGIVGLCNKGEPRKPDDWGALRAWQWGMSRVIDYLEVHPEIQVNTHKIGVEGVSRYGKAALVTEAFDPRVAVAFVASSGGGGAKLLRHDFGEAVENLASTSEYYWLAGNFLKYGAADIKGNSLNASNLPVDAHELIALCAPRPCFISYGSEPGDPKWVDTPGSYRAGILATPVYELLGKKGYGDLNKWVTAELPPVGTLVGGELAFRQHEGGHTAVPNFPAFFEWVGQYVK